MGQYLSFGICLQLKAHDPRKQANTDALKKTLSSQTALNLSNFVRSDNEQSVQWDIDPDILTQELYDFLRQQYSLYYENAPDQGDYASILGVLGQQPTRQAIEKLAEDKRYVNFQLDDYYRETCYIEDTRVALSYKIIILFTEGKIMMETYGGMFDYIQRLLPLAFPDVRLAQCCKLYIAG